MSSSTARGALPPEGSIQEGKVVRIEPYGAFVDLPSFYRVRGLVHISQLAQSKVEKVEDVVALDDGVWVKVLSVTTEADSSTGRVRHKVSLSIKDVSQDGECTDLGAEQEHQHALKQQITQNLQSSIGMGVALDPMAPPPKRKSNLILKHQPNKSQTVINGYALVDDDEPEPPPPRRAAADIKPAEAVVLKPMGRGRGTTLPAWMTRKEEVPPEKKDTKSKPTNGKEQCEDASDDSHSHRKHKKRKHHKDHHKKRKRKHHKDRRKSSHKKHRRREDDEDDRKSSKRSRRDRSRSPSRSRSVSSASSSSSPPARRKRDKRSRSRSPEDGDRRSRRRDSRSRSPSRERGRRRHSDRERSKRRRSRSPSNNNSPSGEFQSVEDAQRLIEQLEAKKQKQREDER